MKWLTSALLTVVLSAVAWSPAIANEPSLVSTAERTESSIASDRTELSENQIDSPSITSSEIDISLSSLTPEISLNFHKAETKAQVVSIKPATTVTKVENTENRQLSESPDGSNLFDIKAAPEGFKILAIISNPRSETNLEYEVTGSEYLELIPVGDGQINILNKSGEYFGTISKPWAVDANGKELSTYFEVSTSKLIQHVVTDVTTTYPVVADPSWTYATDIYLDGYSAPLFKGATSVINQLKACFNCYFPVAGAPRTYPYPGQQMYLTVQVLFSTLYAPVKVISVYTNGWRFQALPGHFDGAGSLIDFRFYNDSRARLHLSVDAIIVNTYSWPTSEANKTAAIATWRTFFNNVS